MCLVAVMDWLNRFVLSWSLSLTMELDVCLEAVLCHCQVQGLRSRAARIQAKHAPGVRRQAASGTRYTSPVSSTENQK